MRRLGRCSRTLPAGHAALRRLHPKAKISSLLVDLSSITYSMRRSSDIVTSIAGESEQSRSKRKQLTNQLDVLVQGLGTCKKFVVGNLHGTFCSKLLRCYV